jgi:hypothetical protein
MRRIPTDGAAGRRKITGIQIYQTRVKGLIRGDKVLRRMDELSLDGTRRAFAQHDDLCFFQNINEEPLSFTTTQFFLLFTG